MIQFGSEPMVGVFDVTGRPVRLGEAIGRGGEACIYRIAGRPEEVAKLYEPAPRPEYPEKLAWMVSHSPLNPTQRQQHASLAWPSALLFDARGKPAGYTMPFIHPAVSLLDVFNPR